LGYSKKVREKMGNHAEKMGNQVEKAENLGEKKWCVSRKEEKKKSWRHVASTFED
jgi:hypothetical protein